MADNVLQAMADNYSKAFPKYPPLIVSHNWIYGVWMIGNNYAGSGYYGAYPPTFLKRVMSMYPAPQRILHLFSGSLGQNTPGDRVDINPDTKPTIVGDAHKLSDIVPHREYDLIIADPPYSAEDANHYGRPMINRNTVIRECVNVVRPGGHLVWLDQVRPMYRKDTWDAVGTIGVVRSTNHRVRMVFIFIRR